MSKQMLNEKTFANVEAYEPITLPGRPDAPSRPATMTVNGTIGRAFFLLILAVAMGAVGWSYGDRLSGVVWTVMLVGLLALFGLSILTAFKPKLAPFTGPVYAVVMGFWAGAISFGYNELYPGIVMQAMFATFAVFAVCLVFYLTGLVRVTDRFVRVVIVATGGIFVMYLAAIVMQLFGVNVTFLDSPSPLGIGLSVVICVVAALNLFIDFRWVDEGAKAGAPTFMSWYSAFGLLATLIWLYLEILRLLSKIRS